MIKRSGTGNFVGNHNWNFLGRGRFMKLLKVSYLQYVIKQINPQLINHQIIKLLFCQVLLHCKSSVKLLPSCKRIFFVKENWSAFNSYQLTFLLIKFIWFKIILNLRKHRELFTCMPIWQYGLPAHQSNFWFSAENRCLW